MKNNDRAQTIDGAAYRIKQGFEHKAGYDKADVVVELVGLIDYLANSNKPRKYDSTVARIAGNIASKHPLTWTDAEGKTRWNTPDQEISIAKFSVARARAIVAETIRTEPEWETRDE